MLQDDVIHITLRWTLRQ